MRSTQSQFVASANDTAMPDEEPRRRGRVEELQRQVDRLMELMHVAVIFGGDKSVEGAVINRTVNPRSWKSYEEVAQDIADALARIGFRKVQLMPDDMRLGEELRRDGVTWRG